MLLDNLLWVDSCDLRHVLLILNNLITLNNFQIPPVSNLICATLYGEIKRKIFKNFVFFQTIG